MRAYLIQATHALMMKAHETENLQSCEHAQAGSYPVQSAQASLGLVRCTRLHLDDLLSEMSSAASACPPNAPVTQGSHAGLE